MAENDKLSDFDPDVDRNGQARGRSPVEVARPAELAHVLNSDPSWQAEVARIASGRARLDSVAGGSVATVEATEAETPDENLRRLGDATLARPSGPAASDDALSQGDPILPKRSA